MRKKLFILLCLCQLISISALAQDHLNIKSIFERYGKQKGSVLVQLSTDVLSQGNSKVTFYKSLITEINDETDRTKQQAIIEALEKDIKFGDKISEIKKGGKLELGNYSFKVKNSNNTYDYILFKRKSKQLTLIYMRGDFPPDKLDRELKKLKDLFIYVNNKRIKLH